MEMPAFIASMQVILSSIGSDGSSPSAHSTLLIIPPPSQSALAKGLEGFNVKIAQISKPSSKTVIQSSAGSEGSSPLKHSVILLIPPPSQSAKARGLVGLANTRIQMSIFPSIAA